MSVQSSIVPGVRRASSPVVAALVVAAALWLYAGRASADDGPVSLDCRIDSEGSWPDGGSWRGHVDPIPDRTEFQATGHWVLHTADGAEMVLRPSSLLCRRDGGRVPEAGGSNIADFTGVATYVGPPLPGTPEAECATWPAGRCPPRVNRMYRFRAHVEDRGEGAYNADDFFAVRLEDDAGNQLFLEADFLASGTVMLIPVEP